MRDFDFQRRFEQVGAYTAWIAAGAMAGALSFDQFGSDHPMRTWLYGLLMVAALFVGLGYTAQLLIGRRAGTAGLNSVQGVIQILLSTVALTGLSAATGGIERPYWIFFVVALIPAAASLPVSITIAAGFLSSAGVVVASFIAGTATANNRGSLTFACAIIPVTAWYSGVLTDGMRRVQERAVRDKARLGSGVQELSQVMAKAAEGDLAVESAGDVVVDESLLLLNGAFTETLNSLRLLVGQIRSGGEQIAASAGELLATAEEHAASATQQSSAVSQTTSTIEELAATAAQIAETAEAVAAYAGETLRHAEEGRSAVSASVAAMDTIAGRVDQIAARALGLGEKSQEIGRILTVIDDLAEQTN
ncbi:MAG: methyl-accepting chemotaxis protein, partial [Actinomycetes bacterium]